MSVQCEELVWYLAYGSNMSTDKFEGSRGIIPRARVPVACAGWQLVMRIPGLAYSEPAFSSIEEKTPQMIESASAHLYGIAYLITKRQHRDVVASEGGGTAYSNIMLVAEPIREKDQHFHGKSLNVLSLGTGMSRSLLGRPSQRYMGLLIEGARHAALPQVYISYLEHFPRYNPPQYGRAKWGRVIFLTIFEPIFQALEQLTKSNIRPDGFTYGWIIVVVRVVVLLSWIVHDSIFAPLFGRGDGLDQF